MPLTADELTTAIAHLRTVLAEKKERLRRELDHTEKRDAVLALRDRFPNISDDQLREAMQRAEV